MGGEGEEVLQGEIARYFRFVTMKVAGLQVCELYWLYALTLCMRIVVHLARDEGRRRNRYLSSLQVEADMLSRDVQRMFGISRRLKMRCKNWGDVQLDSARWSSGFSSRVGLGFAFHSLEVGSPMRQRFENEGLGSMEVNV